MHPSSIGSRLLGFAIAVAVAAWLLNQAAHLLLAVWPVLAPLAGLSVLGAGLWRYLRYRADRW